MATTIASNSTAATFGNSPQKTGEPLDHAKLFSGKALEFDGVTDYLDSGAQTYTLTNNGFTLSCWINIKDIDTNNNYLSYGSGNDYIAFWNQGGQMGIKIDGKATTTNTFTPLFIAGTWHYFTLVYKAGIIYI